MNNRALHFVRMALAFRRATQAEEGGSLVEIALSCLILIPILFGIIQLSMALYCYHYAADAAREATRFAIVRGASCNSNLNSKAYCSPTDSNTAGATQNDITQYVKSLGYPYSGSATVAVQWCTPGGTPAWSSCSTSQDTTVGNQVQVKVTYSYPFVIPFPAKTYNLNIGSVSSMTIVQ